MQVVPFKKDEFQMKIGDAEDFKKMTTMIKLKTFFFLTTIKGSLQSLKNTIDLWYNFHDRVAVRYLL